jgi:hypothetical protein
MLPQRQAKASRPDQFKIRPGGLSNLKSAPAKK